MTIARSTLPLVLTLAVAVLAPASAAADDARSVAVIFLAKSEPDAAILNAVKAEFQKAADSYPEIRVLAPGDLRMRLRDAGKMPLAEAAVLKCGSDLACIAELGRVFAADEVLLVRVGPIEGGPGVALQILVTDSKTKQIARRAKIEVTAADQAGAQLIKHRAEIFGVAGAPTEAIVAEPPPPPGMPSEVHAAWWLNHRAFRYGGLGAAGAGGLALVAGAVFGNKSKSLAGQIDAGTNQVRTAELAHDADTDATRANRLFLLGGLCTVVGGGMLAWEFFGMERFAPTVEVSGDGAKAGVSFAW